MQRRTEVVFYNGRNEQNAIALGIEVLSKGGVIAFPTDTVFGLGVDAKSEKAVLRIYKLKKRKKEKPLVLFIDSEKELRKYTSEIPEKGKILMREFWPGKLTLVFKAGDGCPPLLVSKEGKVGVRIPGNQIPLSLCREFKSALATTSANITEQTEALSCNEVLSIFDGKIELVIDGEKGNGEPSTVVDISETPPVLLRRGEISFDSIEKLIGKIEDRTSFNVLFVCTGNSCRSPMIEAMFKKFIKEKNIGWLDVDSCGTSCLDGGNASFLAIEVMKEIGIDIKNHISKSLTKSLVAKSNLVVVMEKRHKEEVLEIEPTKMNRVFLLKELAGKEGEIEDPIGKSIYEYRKCRDEMKECLSGVLVKAKELKVNSKLKGQISK